MDSENLKAIIFPEPYKVEVIEVEDPKVGPDDVLTETRVSGISVGTERGIYRGVFPKIVKGIRKHPFIPGYNAVGVVKEVGKNVKEVKPGDRVIAGGTTYGVENYTLYWGGHVEYKRSLESEVYKIPEGITFEETTLDVLGGTALNCIRRAKLRFGDTVVVIGQGPLGQLVSLIAKTGGAGRIICIDLFDFKLEISKRVGADYIINAKDEDPVRRVIDLTGGVGADVVVEVTGKGEPVNQAFRMTKKEGKIIVLGRHLKPEEIDLTSDFWYKELTMKGSYDHIKNDIKDLFFSLILTGRIDQWKVKELITHDFPVDKAKEAYELLDKSPEKYLEIIFHWK